jgi:hypothetical protein
MKLSGRRPGTLTTFIDTSRDEVLLQFQADEQGLPLIAFTLYDANGALVAEAPKLQPYPDGVSISSPDKEVLLEVHTDDDVSVMYRLYNHEGKLLTVSDGQRTQIFGYLRMEGNKVSHGRPAGTGEKGAAK